MANLEVPLEIITAGIPSTTGIIDPTYQMIKLNPDNYDGATYYFEIVYTNSNAGADYNITLRSGTTDYATISAVRNNATPIRSARVQFTPAAGDNTYWTRLAATAVAGQVTIWNARIIVVQSGATKTRIQIPLFNAYYTTTKAYNTYVDTVSGSSYAQGVADYYCGIHIVPADWVTIPASGWDIEGCIACSGTGTAYVGFYNYDNSAIVAEATNASTTPAVVRTSFSSSATNFDSGDNFGVELKTSSSSRSCRIGNAFLYVKVTDISKYKVFITLSKPVANRTTALVQNYQRYQINKNNYSGMTAKLGADCTQGTNQNTMYVQDGSTNESGTAGSDLSNSALNASGQVGFYEEATDITSQLTNGNRYILDIKACAGGIAIYYLAVVIYGTGATANSQAMGATSGSTATMTPSKTLPSLINPTLTGVLTLTPRAGRLLSVVEATTPVFAIKKQLKTGLTATETSVLGLLRQTGKLLPATAGSTPVVTTKKTWAQAIVSTLTGVNVLTPNKKWLQSIVSTAGSVGTLIRKTGLSLPAQSGSTALLSIIKQLKLTVPATSGSTAILSSTKRRVSNLISQAGSTSVLSTIKKAYQTVTAQAGSSPIFKLATALKFAVVEVGNAGLTSSKTTAKLITSSTSPTSVFKVGVGLKLPVIISSSVGMVRKNGIILSVVETSSAIFTSLKQILQPVGATEVAIPTVLPSKVKTQALNQISTVLTNIKRGVAFPLTVVATTVNAFKFKTGLTFGVTETTGNVLTPNKKTLQSINSTETGLPVIDPMKGIFRYLNANTTPISSFKFRVGLILNASASTINNIKLATSIRLNAVETSLIDLKKRTGKNLNATINSISNFQTILDKELIATATTISNIGFGIRIALTVIQISIVNMDVLKVLSQALSTSTTLVAVMDAVKQLPQLLDYYEEIDVVGSLNAQLQTMTIRYRTLSAMVATNTILSPVGTFLLRIDSIGGSIADIIIPGKERSVDLSTVVTTIPNLFEFIYKYIKGAIELKNRKATIETEEPYATIEMKTPYATIEFEEEEQ